MSLAYRFCLTALVSFGCGVLTMDFAAEHRRSTTPPMVKVFGVPAYGLMQFSCTKAEIREHILACRHRARDDLAKEAK